MLVSLVIPFHNELENLKVLIPELIEEINKIRKVNFEIILIDDFSCDNSFEYCVDILKNKKIKYTVKRLEKRSGQTGAYKAAFELSNGSYIIRMDADNSNCPKDINIFIDKIILNYDLIIGMDTKKEDKFILSFLRYIYNFLIKIIINSELEQYTGSFIAFNSKFLKKLPWYKNDHRYLPIISILRGAKKIINVKITKKERKFGKSNYNVFYKFFFGFFEIHLFFLRVFLKKYNW